MAQQMGYRYSVAPELEFYMFREPFEAQIPHSDDKSSYFDASPTEARTTRTKIADALESMGVLLESGHHEVGPGQHELDFVPMDALQMADAIMTARLAVKAIAQANGMLATFMPKPLSGVAGSGLHIHQTLNDVFNAANSFADTTS